MNSKTKYERQHEHWEKAGEIGYGKAMFSNDSVGGHIMQRHWRAVIETAGALGLHSGMRVLELGCGDGEFAIKMLSPEFKHVDAFDISNAAIGRASASCPPNVSFKAADASGLEFDGQNKWDAVFMMGFLHHVKPSAGAIVRRVCGVCDAAVLIEPNGNNLIRKSLELLPSYRKAGEDSFKLNHLVEMFEACGFELSQLRRMTIVPPFLPARLLPFMKGIERRIEATPILNRLCSSYILGFAKRAKTA